MTLNDFLDLRTLVTIVHHEPGRIRLKVDPRILTHPAAKVLASLPGSNPEVGLISARVNLLARSLVLEYDSNRIRPEDLDVALAGTDMERVVPLAEQTAALLGIQLQQV